MKILFQNKTPRYWVLVVKEIDQSLKTWLNSHKYRIKSVTDRLDGTFLVEAQKFRTSTRF